MTTSLEALVPARYCCKCEAARTVGGDSDDNGSGRLLRKVGRTEGKRELSEISTWAIRGGDDAHKNHETRAGNGTPKKLHLSSPQRPLLSHVLRFSAVNVGNVHKPEPPPSL